MFFSLISSKRKLCFCVSLFNSQNEYHALEVEKSNIYSWVLCLSTKIIQTNIQKLQVVHFALVTRLDWFKFNWAAYKSRKTPVPCKLAYVIDLDMHNHIHQHISYSICDCKQLEGKNEVLFYHLNVRAVMEIDINVLISENSIFKR